MLPTAATPYEHVHVFHSVVVGTHVEDDRVYDVVSSASTSSEGPSQLAQMLAPFAVHALPVTATPCAHLHSFAEETSHVKSAAQ